MTLNDLAKVEWLEPWHGGPGTPGVSGLELELQREVGAGHPLYHLATSCVAIARRFDRDDVLFAVHEGTGEILRLAEVHLTWSSQRQSDPRWPSCTIYGTFEEWVERSMKPAQEE